MTHATAQDVTVYHNGENRVFIIYSYLFTLFKLITLKQKSYYIFKSNNLIMV